MHPLTRAEGDGENNSPIDPNYPGRYYVDPPCREDETEQTYDWRAGGGYQMLMKYQLPDDLVCEHCVLQTWYCEWTSWRTFIFAWNTLDRTICRTAQIFCRRDTHANGGSHYLVRAHPVPKEGLL